MSKGFFFCFTFFFVAFLQAGYERPGEKLLASIHKRYFQKTNQTVSFSQKTIRYDSTGKVIKTSTWYEKLKFPDKFRIDFDTFPSQNRILFRDDSVFSFRKGILVSKENDKNILLLLLGGMYFRSLRDVISRLDEMNFDLSQTRDTVADNSKYTIIGKAGSNQFWLDKKFLRIKRIIVPSENLDAVIESWVKNGKGWQEEKINFYSKGKIIQREEYYDIRFDIVFDEKVFTPF